MSPIFNPQYPLGMKPLRILWLVSAAWILLWAWKALQLFRGESFWIDLGERSKDVLAGLGSLAIGTLPLLATWLLHRLHKSRERSRLTKEKARIEARLAKLDAQAARRKPAENPS